MAAGNNISALQALIDSFRSDGVIDGDEITDIAQTIKNIFEQNDTDSLDLAWDSGETYDTKATAATSGNPYLSEFGDRFWKSKTDGNINHQPPSDTETTSDTYWDEVSKAASNAISEWSAGVYGAGLIIVFYDDALYKLTVAGRPYESTNIITEIAAEDWEILEAKVLDEDDMVSDDATLPPSQQSTKAFTERITGLLASLNTTDKSSLVAAINELVTILSSNDVNYDELQELVDFIKTIDTDGELLAVIDSAVGANNWRTVATASVLGLVKLYTALGTNTDGAMTQNAIKAEFDALKNNVSIACSDEITDLEVATSVATFRMVGARTITGVRCSVNTAPVGSTIIVDINKNGVSILSTKLTIDASEKTSITAATAAVISTSSIADDDEITIDIDQVGSGTPGKGLKVTLLY